MTSVRIARGVNLLPSDIDNALLLLEHRKKLLEGIKEIRQYLITTACHEDFENLIDKCNDLLILE